VSSGLNIIWYVVVWYDMTWYNMLCFGMILYDVICPGMIWYNMFRLDMACWNAICSDLRWYDISWCMIWYQNMFWFDMVWYVMVWSIWHKMFWFHIIWIHMIGPKVFSFWYAILFDIVWECMIWIGYGLLWYDMISWRAFFKTAAATHLPTTCGPSTQQMRKKWPLGTSKHRASRGGTITWGWWKSVDDPVIFDVLWLIYGSYMGQLYVFLPRWFHIHSLKLKLSSEIHVSCMGCYGNLCIESLGFAPQSTI